VAVSLKCNMSRRRKERRFGVELD